MDDTKHLSKDYIEQRMKFVESLFEKYGAIKTELNAENRKRLKQRATYYFNDCYYRVDFFGDDSFIVIEAESDFNLADVGTMEDAEPFSCDLPDDKIEKEVRFALEIEPYPETYPDY